MIISAQISHYKSIQDTSLVFKPINVIVGPNGSGKSNLLDALYFLHDCAIDDIDTAVTKRHGIDSLRQWSKTKPYNINFSVRFMSPIGTGNYKVIISSNKGNYRIIEESGSWRGPNRYRIRRDDTSEDHFSSFSRSEDGSVDAQTSIEEPNFKKSFKIGSDELFLSQLASRASFGAPNHLRPIAEELMSFSKYNIFPNTLRQPQVVSRETTLLEDGSNLSSVLKRINSSRRTGSSKEDILSALRLLMPLVSDIQIKSAAGFFVPVLRVEEQSGDGHDYNLSQISDGTLRTLGLLAAFYQPITPTKIGIEEPELMIHPGALSVLHEAMESYVAHHARPQRQVFVTTHSPTFIDLFAPEYLVWCQFKNGVTDCGHVGPRQMNIIKKQLFTAGELLLAEGLY